MLRVERPTTSAVDLAGAGESQWSCCQCRRCRSAVTAVDAGVGVGGAYVTAAQSSVPAVPASVRCRCLCLCLCGTGSRTLNLYQYAATDLRWPALLVWQSYAFKKLNSLTATRPNPRKVTNHASIKGLAHIPDRPCQPCLVLLSLNTTSRIRFGRIWSHSRRKMDENLG